MTSGQYANDLNEVKEIGALNSATRTADQTQVARLWAKVNTPTNFLFVWNNVARTVSEARNLSTVERARLFALTNIALHDALQVTFASKFHYGLWRPLTAIREGASDGNALTVADTTWQPLVNTPNYPDYTSGANSLVAAMTHTLEMFFGSDRGPLEVTSLHPLAVKKTRSYARFSDAADDYTTRAAEP